MTLATPDNRVAVITGGAGGLGQAIAHRLNRAGTKIALWDINEEKAEAASRKLPGSRAYRADVTDFAAVEQATADTLRDFGRIDILVNSAGINGPILPLVDYPIDAWRDTLALNLNSVFYCCKAIVKVMLAAGYGRIVNLSSIAGKEGNANASCYSASKAGVIALTKSLGKELAQTEIRVNCVTPAAIDTEMLQQLTPEFMRSVVAKIPMGRLGRADEVGALVAWLASEDCSFSTGAVFDISGGRATY